MSSFPEGRRILLAVLAVLLLAAVFVVSINSQDAQAAPGSNCTYYSNASYTTVVGQFGYDCCNNRVAWGHKTQYVICGGCFVCFPPPR